MIGLDGDEAVLVLDLGRTRYGAARYEGVG